MTNWDYYWNEEPGDRFRAILSIQHISAETEKPYV